MSTNKEHGRPHAPRVIVTTSRAAGADGHQNRKLSDILSPQRAYHAGRPLSTVRPVVSGDAECGVLGAAAVLALRAHELRWQATQQRGAEAAASLAIASDLDAAAERVRALAHTLLASAHAAPGPDAVAVAVAVVEAAESAVTA